MEDKKLMILSRSKEKNQINYSRDYRYLGKGRMSCFVQFFLIIMPVFYVYLVNYDRITYFIAKYTNEFVGFFIEQNTNIIRTNYFKNYGNVYYVTVENKNPSLKLLLISLIITLVGILILSLINTKKNPIMFFLLVALYIQLFSTIYFMVFPNKFPYDVVDYSRIYIKYQIVVWMLIMLVFWFTTSLIGRMLWYRILNFIGLILVEGVFGAVRYVLYLVILAKYSCLFMAVLYFAFGFLWDIIIMVAFYTSYVKKAGTKLSVKVGGKLWKWS